MRDALSAKEDDRNSAPAALRPRNENGQAKRTPARAGWRSGAAEKFPGLKAEEGALVNMCVSLAEKLRDRRRRLGLSHTELARRLGSSQSRGAKREAGETDGSIDLLVRGLLATGAKPGEVGRAIAVA